MSRRLAPLAFVALVVGAGLSGAGCNSNGTFKLTWTFAGDGPTTALVCAQRGVFSILVTGASTAGNSERVEAPCAPGSLTRDLPASTWLFTVRGLDRAGCYRSSVLTMDGGVDGGFDGGVDGGVDGGSDGGGSDGEAVDGGQPEAAADDAATADSAAGEVGEDAGDDAAADVVPDAGDDAFAQAAAPLAACDNGDLAALSAMVGPIDIGKGETKSIEATLTPLPTCADGVDNNGDGRIDLDDPTCLGDPHGMEGAPARP